MQDILIKYIGAGRLGPEQLGGRRGLAPEQTVDGPKSLVARLGGRAGRLGPEQPGGRRGLAPEQTVAGPKSLVARPGWLGGRAGSPS